MPAHSFRLLAETLASGKNLYTETKTHSLAELRALSAEELVKYTKDNHHITVDGYVLNQTPYEAYKQGEKLNAEEILHGYNKQESNAFFLFQKVKKKDFRNKLEEELHGLVPEEKDISNQLDELEEIYNVQNDTQALEAMQDFLTVLWFSYGHYRLTRQALEQDIPVYEYWFTQENGRLGSWHSGEEVYCYGNIPDDSKLYTEEDRNLSKAMLTYWRNFAFNGDPNGSVPPWGAVTDPAKIQEFNAADGTYSKEVDEVHQRVYAVLDEIYSIGN